MSSSLSTWGWIISFIGIVAEYLIREDRTSKGVWDERGRKTQQTDVFSTGVSSFAGPLGKCEPSHFNLLSGVYQDAIEFGDAQRFLSRFSTPIYFDRSKRRVIYVKLTKEGYVVKKVNWELASAGERRGTVGGGYRNTFSVKYLVVLFRAQRDDKAYIDSYVFGDVLFPSMLWEYIVQYMNHAMPPLAHNEPPPSKTSRKDGGCHPKRFRSRG